MNLRSVIFWFFVFFISLYLYAQEPQIKTLQTYAGDNETTLPVISFNGYGSITIEFDVKSAFIPDFNIVFRFCDRNWVPYENLFLRNGGQNVAYNIDLTNLPVTVEDANYHFKGRFPNNYDNVTFPFSGKWKYYITDAQDTTRIFASGQFIVVQEALELRTSLKHEKLEDETFFPADLAKVFNITTDFELTEKLHPSFVDHLEIIENQRIFSPYIADRKFNTNRRQFYWNASTKFSFIVRDIRPGNEYRKTDLRDPKITEGKNVTAQFDGIEYSRFFQNPPRDMNGGFMISKAELFPSYLNVLFQVRPPDENFGNIFLTGSFNNWLVLPEYEMENSGGIYRKTITLKRGIYDYQYVAADVINGEIKNENWYTLEGNNWEATNVYHVFVYYNDPEYGGYDRIIGYAVVLNK